ncbi:MAG: hypothetical protein HQL83_07985 [Magnetococcales bacterium]|nr:hypothetical protein [Magnetococcales bacterium]
MNIQVEMANMIMNNRLKVMMNRVVMLEGAGDGTAGALSLHRGMKHTINDHEETLLCLSSACCSVLDVMQRAQENNVEYLCFNG